MIVPGYTVSVIIILKNREKKKVILPECGDCHVGLPELTHKGFHKS